MSVLKQPTGQELFIAIKSGFKNGYTPWADLGATQRRPWDLAASDLVEISTWDTPHHGDPVHPAAETLYLMVARNNEHGYFPFGFASDAAKASYESVALRFCFHPDTIMAKHRGGNANR